MITPLFSNVDSDANKIDLIIDTDLQYKLYNWNLLNVVSHYHSFIPTYGCQASIREIVPEPRDCHMWR